MDKDKFAQYLVDNKGKCNYKKDKCYMDCFCCFSSTKEKCEPQRAFNVAKAWLSKVEYEKRISKKKS